MKPVVHDLPDFGVMVAAALARLRDGQEFPGVTSVSTTSGGGLSVGHFWLPPRHRPFARFHHHTDVAVHVIQGGLVILWWDEHGKRHELPLEPGQHLRVPPGTVYASTNPHDVPATVTDVRHNPTLRVDVEILRDLDTGPEVMPVSGRGGGGDRVRG